MRRSLAGGGLANAQLLLASDHVQPNGLGNAHDQVGRHLMDHPLLFGGDFVPRPPGTSGRWPCTTFAAWSGTPIMGHLQLTDHALRNENLLNLSMMLFPRERNYREHIRLSARQQQGFEAGLSLRRSWQHRRPPGRSTVMNALRGIDGLAKRSIDSLMHPKANITRGGWSAAAPRPFGGSSDSR